MVCTEGVGAPDLARRYRPAVILLDWTLRETDGGQVLACLRQDAITRSIPVIMMSAWQDGALRAQAAGADAFLPKPFGADELVEVVNAMLRGSSDADPPPPSQDEIPLQTQD